MTAKAVGRT